MTSGLQGYAEQSAQLIERYEAIDPAERHRGIRHLIPSSPADVLDIGAGTGRDAAWLAGMGHRVVAVEPTREFRAYGRERHPSPRIEWIDDTLPGLPRIANRKGAFDLVLLTAVWMHLDETQRTLAMPVLASLLAPAGTLILSVRHGPPAEGRVMFEAPSSETIGLAAASGLRLLLDVPEPSTQAANHRAGVTWSRLAFAR